MVKEAIQVEVSDNGEKDTFEYCVMKLNINRKTLVVVGIYHPPAAAGKTNQQFIKEFLGPYSQKVLGLNVLYECIEFKPKTWLSPFVNTSPGVCCSYNYHSQK